MSQQAFPRPVYEIGALITSTMNQDAPLNAVVSDKRFQVRIFAAKLEGHPDILDQHIRLLERIDPKYVPREMDFLDPVEELYEWALKPLFPIFPQVSLLDPNQAYSLEDCLYPETFYYTLEAADNNLIAVQQAKNAVSSGTPVGVLLSPQETAAYSSFHIYEPKDIIVHREQNATILPTRMGNVYTKDGSTCFFQAIGSR
jgi:hypothetical protein